LALWLFGFFGFFAQMVMEQSLGHGFQHGVDQFRRDNGITEKKNDGSRLDKCNIKQ